MIIDELSSLHLPVQSTDELPIERGELTYKVTYNNLVGSEIAGVKSNITTLQGNVTTLQNADSKIESSIAIIIEGNQTTHMGGVAVGEYVIVRNSTISGITDGLYKATQAIPANTAIYSTYLVACPDGGINALNASMIQYFDYDVTGVNLSAGSFNRWGVTDLQPGETSLNKRIGIIVINTYQAFAALTNNGRFYIYANSALSNATVSVRIFFIP